MAFRSSTSWVRVWFACQAQAQNLLSRIIAACISLSATLACGRKADNLAQHWPVSGGLSSIQP